MKELTDKLVVVTGAASGIGRAAASAFAAQGCRVVICDVQRDALTEVERALGARCVLAETVDVASREAMAAFADRVHRKVGVADVIINNAGVGVDGGLLDTPLDDWQWLMSVNFWGVVHGCHFFVPKMVERGRGGHVVNVASAMGYFATSRVLAYASSKFAVIGMSAAMRAELRPHNIDVSVMCPGLINSGILSNTRFFGSAAADSRKLAEKVFSKGASPDRVAAAMVRAVRKGRDLVPVTPEAWALYYVSRFLPQLQVPLARFFVEMTGAPKSGAKGSTSEPSSRAKDVRREVSIGG
jgi:NAD(P)-dependent dehydrogenase (short-subunit alcohol dehydrogenase family)